jgi:hypothetical protein
MDHRLLEYTPKSFVRFPGESVKNAAGVPARIPTKAAAEAAAVQAARRYAPGLLSDARDSASADGDYDSARPTAVAGWSGRHIMIVNC